MQLSLLNYAVTMRRRSMNGIQFVLTDSSDTYSYFSLSKKTSVTMVRGKCQITSLQQPINKQLNPVFQVIDNSIRRIYFYPVDKS